ncbi:MAG: pyridoxal phosphate-dependent aminotransferase [Polyangiaceae bacterium]
MSLGLASRLSVIHPSATLAMAAEAAKLTAQGIQVFNFSVGEPDFPTPKHIRASAAAAVEGGATRYTPATGTPDLKAAIVAAAERDRGYKTTPDRIVVSCGAKHVLFNLAEALYDPGDEVIIPAPYWVSYPEQVRLVGAVPVIAETTEAQGFLLQPAELERLVTPKTKAVILCTPSNPTGAAYDRRALEGLIEVIKKGDYYVIVDEIYADLVYDGFVQHSMLTLAPELAERIIVVDGVSKTYAMTGWRIGWSISSPKVASAIAVVQGQSTTNPAAVSQAAAAAALRGARHDLEDMRTAFERRRNLMIGGLNTIPGVRCRKPEGAFYAFADVSGLIGKKVGDTTLASDTALAQWLLREAHVVTVAGEPFGAPGYLRLSYACADATIEAGLAAFKRAVTAS